MQDHKAEKPEQVYKYSNDRKYLKRGFLVLQSNYFTVIIAILPSYNSEH